MLLKTCFDRTKLYTGIASVAALALFTSCASQDPTDTEPGDLEIEEEETPAPDHEIGEDDPDDPSDPTGEEAPDGDSDEADNASGDTANDDEVRSIIEAVDAEYTDGFIVEITQNDNDSQYNVDVVA